MKPSLALATRSSAERVVMDDGLLRKYGGQGPRYTSYPTADRFVEAFDAAAYRHWLANRDVGGCVQPLGVYVHIPFCDTLCFYCACNKIAARDRAKGTRYVDYVLREMRLASGALQGGRRVAKMHWGGGTPTFLAPEDCERLFEGVREAFQLDPAGEYAIEIDPRKADGRRIEHLGRLGFNRISIGVQDFDPAVQRAVNRVQSLEQTAEAIQAARESGFRSVNLDLILGLPKQTTQGFEATLASTIACGPDRVALYSYAHLPSAFTPQQRIVEADLPSPEAKLAMMRLALRMLGDAGYVHIGMDHFAKPDDELAVAQRQGRLVRDFQGYSSGGDCDLLAFGVSAIGKVGPSYVQNVKDLPEYYARIDAGDLPVLRGMQLTTDDLIRRSVIQALACQFSLPKESVSLAWLIDFDRYFAAEMRDLEGLAADGLVELDGDWIHVTARGRLLVRAVCMVFDRYLRDTARRDRYSRVM